MKVLVSGATGFVGKVVVKKLLEQKHRPVVLTRNSASAALTLGGNCDYLQWNELSAEKFDSLEIDGVIHLAGEGIADKPWTIKQKKKIYESRIDRTRELVEALAASSKTPKVFVSTSAIGIYGHRPEEELTEESSFSNDYLAKVCKDWEAQVTNSADAFERVAILRVGVVLGKNGGALAKMIPPFRFCVGGPLGNGKQMVSWVHLEDLAKMYVEALTNSAMSGVLNATAPYPVTNKEMSQTLGKTMGVPSFMAVPGFVLETIFGEMSSILLDSAKVIPTKLKETNFHFQYPTIELAIKEVLSRKV